MAGKICHEHCPGGGHDGLVAVAAMVAVCALAYGARVLIGDVLAIILACLVTLAAGGVVVLVAVLRGTRCLAPPRQARRAQAISAPPLAIEAATHRISPAEFRDSPERARSAAAAVTKPGTIERPAPES